MFGISSNYFKIFLNTNKVKYGTNLKMNGMPIIYKDKNAKLSLGNNCLINSRFLSNLIGLYQASIIIARDESKIEIGNNVRMSGVTIYSRKLIKIGDNANIGGNVKIIDNDFHPVDCEARLIDDKTKINSKEIIIGTNVFIGCNSIILKGTKLGDNCIVGAGSVVCGEFPGNTTIAGNPARIIKQV